MQASWDTHLDEISADIVISEAKSAITGHGGKTKAGAAILSSIGAVVGCHSSFLVLRAAHQPPPNSLQPYVACPLNAINQWSRYRITSGSEMHGIHGAKGRGMQLHMLERAAGHMLGSRDCTLG